LCSVPSCAATTQPSKVERASFALTEYLEGVLGQARVASGLFPQYRDVQDAGGCGPHSPADLWPAERRFVTLIWR
jgi:chemosensory pili system protein ChpA (sensor histidine kinase/response regulator)